MCDSITRIQPSFVSGDLSPRLLGRIDLDKYASGCSDITNMVVMPQGGLQNRPGFRFIAEAKTHARKCRLVPFQFSITQAYILEFEHQYIRFYADGGQVMNGAIPAEVATTYTEAELPYLRFAQSADVLFITHPPIIRPCSQGRALQVLIWLLSPGHGRYLMRKCNKHHGDPL